MLPCWILPGRPDLMFLMKQDVFVFRSQLGSTVSAGTPLMEAMWHLGLLMAVLDIRHTCDCVVEIWISSSQPLLPSESQGLMPGLHPSLMNQQIRSSGWWQFLSFSYHLLLSQDGEALASSCGRALCSTPPANAECPVSCCHHLTTAPTPTWRNAHDLGQRKKKAVVG